jgi:ribosomal protein S18 acetylase RimI-like enzyme
MAASVDISQVDGSALSSRFEELATRSFSNAADSTLDDWFSFPEMREQITAERGLCLAAYVSGQLVGFVYAQQESPINAREGLEKWVIVLAAVDPAWAAQGVGTSLLSELESLVAIRGGCKLFVYTNAEDDRVIRFYQRCGYSDAGWVRDYQYGTANSAVFLLKHLRVPNR